MSFWWRARATPCEKQVFSITVLCLAQRSSRSVRKVIAACSPQELRPPRDRDLRQAGALPLVSPSHPDHPPAISPGPRTRLRGSPCRARRGEPKLVISSPSSPSDFRCCTCSSCSRSNAVAWSPSALPSTPPPPGPLNGLSRPWPTPTMSTVPRPVPMLLGRQRVLRDPQQFGSIHGI